MERFQQKKFGERVTNKVDDMLRNKSVSAHDWKTIHTLITLMHRTDQPSARKWIDILVGQLDSIMKLLEEERATIGPRPGLSC